MSFQTTKQIKNQQSENQKFYSPNPWFRWQKKSNGYVDYDQAPVTFRFLCEFDDLIFSHSHWDHDIKRAVACNRQIKATKDGKVYLAKGDCWYCDQVKAAKEKFEAQKAANDPAVKDRKFPPKPYKLNGVFVAPVATAVKDGDGNITGQQFHLLAIPALDYLFSTAKGFYGLLNGFGDMAKKRRKPQSIMSYWWDLSADLRNMFADDQVGKSEQIDIDDVPGYLNVDGKAFEMKNAAPMPYKEALKERKKLDDVNAKAEPIAPQKPIVEEKPEEKAEAVEDAEETEESDSAAPW